MKFPCSQILLYGLTVLGGLIGLAGCTDEPMPVRPDGFDAPLVICAPSWSPVGGVIPVAGWIPELNPRRDGRQMIIIRPAGGAVGRTLTLTRGRGADVMRLHSVGLTVLEAVTGADNLLYRVGVEVVQAPVVRILSGELSDADLNWKDRELISLTGDITVPAGETLRIAAGVRVESGSLVNVFVYGRIECLGTEKNPVVFCAMNSAQPWGEISHFSSGNRYRWTFFTGGGDVGRAFGHSGSQPVISGRNAQVEWVNVFILDNPGKALGLENSRLRMDSCLVTRCDTDGELAATHLNMNDCWFVDFPSPSGSPVDDDNDALYLNGAAAGDTSVIRRSVFSGGCDDGIDHNGAIVRVESCLIEGFDNEGIAASNRNRIEVFNTLIMNCEQGIEAGYGEPAVVVEHCLLLGNETGLHFGDWYVQPCTGDMRIINTISFSNRRHNIWNWVIYNNGPQAGALKVTYSLVNTPPYDNGLGCIVGEPLFELDYTLAAGSPGIGSAADGGDFGLLSWGRIR